MHPSARSLARPLHGRLPPHPARRAAALRQALVAAHGAAGGAYWDTFLAHLGARAARQVVATLELLPVAAGQGPPDGQAAHTACE